MKRTIAVIGLAASLVTGVARGQTTIPNTAGGSIARCVSGDAERLDFSGVVSIVDASGEADYSRGRSIGADGAEFGANTPFNLASVGKMFTAVAVAQLVDQRKVDLDDPIGRFVEGLRPATAAVTVRQLLTHSSGLGNFFSPANVPALQRARTVADLLPLVAGEEPQFTPGSRFEYSNSGFLLLGRIVEIASGMPYDEYLRIRIFEPARMTASTVEAPPASRRAEGMTTWPELPPHRNGQAAAGVPPPQGPMRPATESALRGSPAGGSYSTAADLQRFLAALVDGRLTSPAMLDLLTSPQIVVRPAREGLRQVDFGLGFGIGTFDGRRWFGHNGGAPGANTEVAYYPDARIGVVVLSNRDPPAATEMFRRARAIAFDRTACATTS